ncbi:nitrile hydratase subunit beta [Mycobacterium sp. E2327]|uniref:nitrile hydratase subunit beta n=1 Tax=Mycobacterium sp. E2327 TaxID=1834132 RepID=UPI0007FE2709|nr:nitrile hydratase subunit beta [Mycobacterium sp. E2327]OBI17700.1 nitrile hydratase subunit beta [Mycobacterium sp. E2327]
MNGQHDLGGIQSFGPPRREHNEPAFHNPWEGRVEAMTMILLMRGLFGGGGALRHAMESLPPLRYLVDSYYERHLDGLESLLVDRMLLSAEEIRVRAARLAADASAPPQREHIPVADVLEATMTGGGAPTNRRDIDRTPRFALGDAVIAINMHPRGHTRLPRYVRGRPGTIVRVHPAAVFPDTDARGQGEHPQHVYTVRFDSHDLWGATAEQNEEIYVGLWEAYLEAA